MLRRRALLDHFNIRRALYVCAKQEIEVKTLTLFGGEAASTFTTKEAKPKPARSSRPFVSFTANGEPYFVHG